MSRQTIVRLITRLNIGGPAHQALFLTRSLASEYDTVLAAGTPPADEGELAHPDVEVRRVPLTRPIAPLGDLRALRAVKALLNETRPALVHTHMAKAGAAGRFAAARMTARPVTIHTFHGHVLDAYFREPIRTAFIHLERRLARRTDVLIAVSDQTRSDLLALGIGKPEQWRVVPVGIDLVPYLKLTKRSGPLRKELGISAEAFVVASLGRLTAIKDHATLIEAVSALPDCHLVLFGDGEAKAALTALAQRRGSWDRIHFYGWTRDVASALREVDVVAITSLNEGTPVSLIEASAAARPVVATDVGGVRSVVRDGETGLLVAPKDPTAVAAALSRINSDSSFARELGRRGREHVRGLFGESRLLSDIRDLYGELLETHARPSPIKR